MYPCVFVAMRCAYIRKHFCDIILTEERFSPVIDWLGLIEMPVLIHVCTIYNLAQDKILFWLGKPGQSSIFASWLRRTLERVLRCSSTLADTVSRSLLNCFKSTKTKVLAGRLLLMFFQRLHSWQLLELNVWWLHDFLWEIVARLLQVWWFVVHTAQGSGGSECLTFIRSREIRRNLFVRNLLEELASMQLMASKQKAEKFKVCTWKITVEAILSLTKKKIFWIYIEEIRYHENSHEKSRELDCSIDTT